MKRALRARFGAVVKEPVPDTLLSLLSEVPESEKPENQADSALPRRE
ncbi:NepR family anti-sigma factor (plasmid) [Komagataeibacter nataicola]|nr:MULTISPECIES: NepR family anti-sigma factor [Acetobacteraceae]MCW4578936.1 hypothetical protein [Gluconacetobacter entanii]MCW4582333.1 hypothetical protein [Gluconacetobacter entanii]MCW4585716.1 hypothetical protein [Gluconacetobacter entanii]WEQ54369.1 NepR family anti-sigma factor [Komagataeibacter nataicola]